MSPISTGNIAPRICARYSATRCSAAICVANVFVAATQISGPACVYITASASRASDEPIVFVTAITFEPCRDACRAASSVSIVSPDWLTASVSVFGPRTGSRYRNSEAMSISTGTRVQCSIAYFATRPEWNAVPHATTNTLSTSRRTSVSVCSSSSASRPCSLTRPTSVSRIAEGCSWISFSMKSSNPPFWARATSHSTSKGSTLDLGAVEIGDANAVGPHLDDLVLVDRQDGPRLLEHRGDVRGEDVLAVAEPDDQRRGDADPDDDVGFVEREDDERVRAVELADRGAHAVRERPFLLLDQVGDDLGVGLGIEDVPALLEPGTQVGEVLDDPVVDHRDRGR